MTVDKKLIAWVKRSRALSIVVMIAGGILYIALASENDRSLLFQIVLCILMGAGAGVLYAAERVKRILLANTSSDVGDFKMTFR